MCNIIAFAGHAKVLQSCFAWVFLTHGYLFKFYQDIEQGYFVDLEHWLHEHILNNHLDPWEGEN